MRVFLYQKRSFFKTQSQQILVRRKSRVLFKQPAEMVLARKYILRNFFYLKFLVKIAMHILQRWRNTWRKFIIVNPPSHQINGWNFLFRQVEGRFWLMTVNWRMHNSKGIFDLQLITRNVSESVVHYYLFYENSRFIWMVQPGIVHKTIRCFPGEIITSAYLSDNTYDVKQQASGIHWTPVTIKPLSIKTCSWLVDFIKSWEVSVRRDVH